MAQFLHKVGNNPVFLNLGSRFNKRTFFYYFTEDIQDLEMAFILSAQWCLQYLQNIIQNQFDDTV